MSAVKGVTGATRTVTMLMVHMHAVVTEAIALVKMKSLALVRHASNLHHIMSVIVCIPFGRH